MFESDEPVFYHAAYDCECGGCEIAGQQGRTCGCIGAICPHCGMCEGEHCFCQLEEEYENGDHSAGWREAARIEIMRRKRMYHSH